MNGLCFQERPGCPQRLDEVAIAVAVDGRGAGVGPIEAENEAHRCRLPGAVRAEEPSDLAGLNGERQMIDGDFVAVPLAQITRLNQADYLSSLTP
jgi:hypothetical protein